MKKVVVTGPESSGKTTLCQHLSESLFTPFVREYAREFIASLGRPYCQKDLVLIANGQQDLEEDIESLTPSMLICDTDLLTIKIWSEYKYGNCESQIVDQLKNNLPDLYILTVPDFPWEKDEQRENPNDREELFEIYKQEIKTFGVPYIEVSGTVEARLNQILNFLKKF